MKTCGVQHQSEAFLGIINRQAGGGQNWNPRGDHVAERQPVVPLPQPRLAAVNLFKCAWYREFRKLCRQSTHASAHREGQFSTTLIAASTTAGHDSIIWSSSPEPPGIGSYRSAFTAVAPACPMTRI